MPKIDINERVFWILLGKRLKDDELTELLPVAKAEFDGREDGKIKFELNDTNRPDLWSAAGLARALKTYGGGPITHYPFFSKKGDMKDAEGREIIDDESVLGVRDYSIAFAARGHEIDDGTLRTIINSHEKICWNFGRKRRTIAMGIYRSDILKYPVHFVAADPDRTKFVPLEKDELMSLREINEKTEQGKAYGYIVENYERWPFLYADDGEALSNPPVVNSATLGTIKPGMSEFFIEMSGPILEDLMLAVNILACDMYDMGWEILPVKAHLARRTPYGEDIVMPFYFQKKQKVMLEDVHKTLGEPLTLEECQRALLRMGVESRIINADEIEITCPPYRNDFLHPLDITEDIMIGHGLMNFTPMMPEDFTVGRLSPAEERARRVKDIMVGLGFQEMMYNYLGSRKEYIDNMRVSGDDAVFILNPMSENWEVVRPSVMPSLLESESVSASAVYPHNIFEVGKITLKDSTANSGTRTVNSLGFLSSDVRRTYNDASSFVNTLLYYLGKTYTLEEAKDDVRFIPGRAASIIVAGKKVGVFGETHPEVLSNWGSTMPTIMGEIDLDALFEEDEAEEAASNEKKDASEEILCAWSEKVILKVAKIVDIKRHPEGDKLYILTLDAGEEEERTIVSSIVPFYSEDELLNHNIVVVSNLKPANFRGVKSRGMLLAAQEEGDETHSTCEVIFVDEAPLGAVCTYEGAPRGIKKSDTYLKAEHFFALPMKTIDGVVMIEGRPVLAGEKRLVVKKYKNGIVG